MRVSGRVDPGHTFPPGRRSGSFALPGRQRTKPKAAHSNRARRPLRSCVRRTARLLPRSCSPVVRDAHPSRPRRRPACRRSGSPSGLPHRTPRRRGVPPSLSASPRMKKKPLRSPPCGSRNTGSKLSIRARGCLPIQVLDRRVEVLDGLPSRARRTISPPTDEETRSRPSPPPFRGMTLAASHIVRFGAIDVYAVIVRPVVRASTTNHVADKRVRYELSHQHGIASQGRRDGPHG